MAKTKNDPIDWERVKENRLDENSDISRALEIYRSNGSFIVLDTETTGFCAGKGDRIIEVAFQRYEIDGGALREGEIFNSYVDPMRPIPWKITGLTRIADRDVIGKPRIGELLPDICRFMGEYPLIGHNLSFDLRFLNPVMVEAGYDLIDGNKTIDTLKISRIMYGRNRKHTLRDCCMRETVDAFSGAGYHSALHDVKVTAEVFFSLLKKIVKGK